MIFPPICYGRIMQDSSSFEDVVDAYLAYLQVSIFSYYSLLLYLGIDIPLFPGHLSRSKVSYIQPL